MAANKLSHASLSNIQIRSIWQLWQNYENDIENRDNDIYHGKDNAITTTTIASTVVAVAASTASVV